MALNETSLAAYVDGVRGWLIDVDGVFGAQCWDQWSHYATNFLGVPSWPTYTNAGGTHPHEGYACNVHHNARAAGLEEWFEILPPDATPKAGDVAFWEYGSAWYPWSHVASVLEVTHGGRMLRCLTQNPGAVQIADLIIDGVIGYLRPRALNVGALNTAKTSTLARSVKLRAQMRRIRRRREGSTMLFFYCYDNNRYFVVTPGVKGSFWDFATKSDNAARMADQRGNAMHVSQKTFDHHKTNWG